MTALSKSLWVVAAAGIVAGSILDFGGFAINPSWTVVLPFGVVAFGFFLISFALETEAAKFDLDEARGAQLAPAIRSAPAQTDVALIIPLPSAKSGH
jgi:hypothetical protein